MGIRGRVQNGVVVLDDPAQLPEGARVVVSVLATSREIPRVECQPGELPLVEGGPVLYVSPVRQRVELPLVKSSRPGSLALTNEQIAEILEVEDVEALKGQWNTSSRQP